MQKSKEDISFYDLFWPLTTRKIINFIIILGICIFFNAFFNNFVWDDRTFIQFNPDVQKLDIGYLLKANMFNNINAGQYRFFVALYFTVLHTLFGDNTFFYHVLQIGIHILNTVLVFFLLKRFLQKEMSFFLSLIFLVHPMQVESVSYIASSGNPLFTLFGLLALLLSLGMRTWKKSIAIFSFLLFSLLSKETGILFVVLVVVYQIFFQKKNMFHYVLYSVMTVLLYCYIRFVVAGVFFSKVTLAPITRLEFHDRILSIPAVIFYYLKTFLFPSHLAVEQYWVVEKIDIPHFYIPLFFDCFFVAFIFFGWWYFWKRNKKIFFQIFFFSTWVLMGFFVYSQITALDMTVADRWFYFPMIGLLAIIGIWLETTFSNDIYKNRFVLLSMIVLISLLSLRTIVRNTNWVDPITLYTHDALIENNYDLQNSLGGELNSIGQGGKAFVHFQQSVKMFAHETNLFNLALLYEQKGDRKSAEKYYWQAYQAKSYGEVPLPHKHHSVTYVRLSLLVLQHDPPLAVEIIDKGIQDYPTEPMMWYVKTLCEYKLGHQSQALAAAQKLTELLPKSSNASDLYNRLLHNQVVDTTIK